MTKNSARRAFLRQQTKIPLILIGYDSSIAGVNESLVKISGFKQKEFQEKKVASLVQKNALRSFNLLLKQAKGKEIVSGDFNFYSKKGFPVESKVTLWNSEKLSCIIGAITVGENIERLKHEIDTVNRIADHNLKKLVKTNEKLQDARKAEQDALNTKEKFLTNISHELRTPLTGISGITQLLAKTRLNPQQKDYVDNILRSAENLVSMINELLDLSKIKSGKFELEISEFSLYECLKNVASAFSIISNNKNITFNFSYDKNIPPVLIGDALRINQIINNLLNNAFKFTRDGYIHLNVTLKKNTDGVAWIDFEVSDTGIGIDKEKLKSIFEEFKQAELGTSRQYGGTGLGLSIVQHLVKMHKGEIYVKSKPKKGSSFYFTLPLPVGKKIKQADTKTSERLKGFRILVADDNMVNILVIENILKKEGVHVFNAMDGREAYALFKKNEVDLVLLDLNMPKMNGFELTKLLRKKEQTKLPIVAVTAGNPETVESKCYEAGFSGIIFKPFRNEDFVKRLEKFLVKKTNPDETESVTEKVAALTLPAKKNSPKTMGPDFSTLVSLSGGEASIFNDLLTSIIDNIRVEIPRLRKAVDKKDFKNIHFISHKIKTSYGYVGLQEELDKLKTMEDLSESEDHIEEIKSLFASVFDAHIKLLALLEKSFR